jgi:UDP-N-acetylglucosamine/UDP-N-acetylgalactosamine diphosphorylase
LAVGGEVSRNAPDWGVLQRRFEAHGQAHVFRFWDDLAPGERDVLVRQCEALDLSALLPALDACRGGEPDTASELSPPSVERLPALGDGAARSESAARRGEALLSGGRVGVLVVAGGQATRLGFAGPKGLFPIGPVSNRTLFELQAQKLRRLRERCGTSLPWYVMTSPATDAPTRAFFRKHDNLGLPPEDLFFFVQGTVPSFDFDGRLILAERGRLAENPNGHGGVVTALEDSGALDDMEHRGITTLFYHQVDNPLVRMADPVFLGFHAQGDAQMSCKVVRKTDPHEKVGVLAQRGGATTVVEYTELDEELRAARDTDGGLRYWAGNVAIHVFEVSFLRQLAREAEVLLPYHASEKKIPGLDSDGRRIEPETPNGLKLERFVFDALPAARRVCILEAERAEEFSPVKNARGLDSPETAREDLVAQYTRWLEAAGLAPPSGHRIEIDHSQIDSADDARTSGLSNLSDTKTIMFIEPGANA